MAIRGPLRNKKMRSKQRRVYFNDIEETHIDRWVEIMGIEFSPYVRDMLLPQIEKDLANYKDSEAG